MRKLTLLSNGYGEDSIGALLAQAWRHEFPHDRLQAYPSVDRGLAYERAGIAVLGPRRAMPSGGLLMHSLPLFWADMRAGFLPMTLRQLRDLRKLETDVLIVIGDIYALLLSSLIRTRRRYYVQPLISAYHREGAKRRAHRLFMEEYTGLERSLIQRLVTHMYVRDEPTASYLQQRGIDKVSALSNPMLDALSEPVPLELPLESPVVALLPGTRRYAAKALLMMLQALTQLPESTGVVAWAGSALPESLPVDWVWVSAPDASGVRGFYQQGTQRVYLLEGRFAAVLSAADLALGTAGTANEQAASLGLPVVTFPVPPDYSPAFLENQKRLLAEALTVALPTPRAIAQALKALLDDKAKYQQAAKMGRQRMGPPGGAVAIVEDIARREGLIS